MALRITGSVIGEPITSTTTSATGMWTSQEVAALQKDGIWQSPVTYSLTANASNVNEGSSVTITLTTTGIANGGTVPYIITGANIFANDSANGILTGNFVIQNGSNTISFFANADLTLENTETFTITAGTAFANVIINDTSTGLDPYFPNTVLLLHGDGTNNSQNNTFLDLSTNNFTLTRNGNSTQGTFTPYGANWSNYFDGTGDYLSIPDGVAFEMGTGDFTIEAWVNPSALSASDARIWSYQGAGGTVLILYILASGTGSQFAAAIRSHGATGYTQTNGTTVAKVGTWYHVAFSRSSGTTKLFVNGTQEGSTQTSQTQNIQTPSSPSIGGYSAGSSEYFTGYISNIRVIKGTAVYTTAFSSTVPTTPLTAISGTSLLTCQSNRFKDNSTNNFALTVAGDVKVQRFAPYSLDAAYSVNTIGGSGYFDGTGDYLSLPTNQTPLALSNSDWTVEAWVYRTSTSTGCILVGQGDNATAAGSAYVFYVSSSATSDVYGTGFSGGGIGITSPNPPVNTWAHVAWVRTGGTYSSYLNGVRVGTASTLSTNSINVGSAANPPCIGSATNGNGLQGYISNLRLIKGSGGYDATQSTIQIPTAPLTAITNTTLLTNFTNGGIIDNSMMYNLETVGDAKISTANSKFGGSSMFLDGNGDYLFGPVNNTLSFGTGDFTIEAWTYMIATPSVYAGVFDCRSGSSVQNWIFGVYNTSGLKVDFLYGATRLTGTTILATNTWNHIAVTRASGNVRIFVNGVFDVSAVYSSAIDPTGTTFNIGRVIDPYYWNGYLDDVRITKGTARYTANFTPPTLTFTDR